MRSWLEEYGLVNTASKPIRHPSSAAIYYVDLDFDCKVASRKSARFSEIIGESRKGKYSGKKVVGIVLVVRIIY